MVYGTVFKVEDFNHYVVYLGTGLVIVNVIAASLSSAPSLFEYNAGHLKNTNLNPVFYSLEEWAFRVQSFLQSFFLLSSSYPFINLAYFSNMIVAGILPLINLVLFIYWIPLLLCLLGVRYRDLFQLVPIVIQLVFLLSPVLYDKKNLGNLGWTADFNPFYRVLSPFRHALLQRELKLGQSLIILLVNIVGICTALLVLDRQRKHLPFLV